MFDDFFDFLESIMGLFLAILVLYAAYLLAVGFYDVVQNYTLEEYKDLVFQNHPLDVLGGYALMFLVICALAVLLGWRGELDGLMGFLFKFIFAPIVVSILLWWITDKPGITFISIPVIWIISGALSMSD